MCGSLAQARKGSSGSLDAKPIGLWVDLGVEGYLSTYCLQEQLNELCGRGEVPATVILVEHRPCVTLGRASSSLPITGLVSWCAIQFSTSASMALTLMRMRAGWRR